MKLHVIASSSEGNAYILEESNGAQLLLECGVRYPRIQKALEFELSNIAACLVTHEHKDHSFAWKEVIAAGIDIYTGRGTANALGIDSHRLNVAVPGEMKRFGVFDVLPFKTQHDAAEPLGWLIRSSVSGDKYVFATDTYYIAYCFSGIKAFMIELNYCQDILLDNISAGRVHGSLAKRIVSSHFELENVAKFLKASGDEKTEKVVLMHLSDSNSDEKRMIAACEKAARCEAKIANAGDIIELGISFL